MRRQLLLLIVCLAFVAGSFSCLTGCRISDKLKEILYDQTADIVEYDNEEKYYINDTTAEEESTLVPASETSDNAPASDEKQNLVIYSSTPNHDEYIAKKSVFAKDPDFRGIEASEGVTLQYSTSDEAIDHEVPHEEEEKEEDQPEEVEAPQPQQTQSPVQTEAGGQTGSGNDGGSKGASDADDAWEDVDPPPGETKDEQGEESPTEEENGGGSGGDVEVVDTTGAFTEPPKSDSVAAFGEAAVIVQMVGGQGALAATDAETLNGDFMTVFADEGASSIAVGWSDEGSADAIDADAIVDSGAKTVLVYASNYKDGVPADELKKLNKAGVSFTVIPTLANSTYIKQAVTTVGDILSESEEIGNAGKTVDVAADYKRFHDDLVNACIAANGGSLASSGTTVYEAKSKGAYLFNNDARYTLLIDGFDSSARYAKAIGGWVPECNGAAMTTLGYSDSPVSFYIQAGGLINNAAAVSSSGESEQVVAWQFNTNILPAEKGNWEYDSDGLMAKSANIDSAMAEGWRRTVFNTGIRPAANGAACSFGSSRFPKVIVTDSAIRDKMVENSFNVNGLYHPYPLTIAQEGGLQISAIGPLVKNGTIVYSSIGVDVDGSTTEWSGGGIPNDAFAVNPSGLFCSWVDGSVESVLEAAWVNDVVNPDSATLGYSHGSREGYEAYIVDFYDTFYRYELTDTELARIVGE